MPAFSSCQRTGKGLHTQGRACAAVLKAFENTLIFFDTIPSFASFNTSLQPLEKMVSLLAFHVDSEWLITEWAMHLYKGNVE